VHCPVHEHGLPPHLHEHGFPPHLSPLPQGRGGGSPSPLAGGNEYVICNCCTCGCVPYILNRELGQKVYPLLRGAFVAETDLDRCAGHGACVEACPFGVRAVAAGKAQLVEACFGCGACVAACPERAIEMVGL
jgi:ferredoxin